MPKCTVSSVHYRSEVYGDEEDDVEKAACYVRVSTQEQATEGCSLEAQEERLRAYCALQGLQVAEVIRDEGVSAAKPLETRPGGERLLDLLKRGEVRHVVALKLDRLFRNAEDALKNTGGWDRRGVALHLVDMGGQSLNTASAVGRMMLTMLAAFAEFERNLIAERTATALAFKKQRRRVFGPIPLGYRRDGDDLVPVSEELELVGRIRAWRADGASLRTIVARLDAEKAVTKRGGKWHVSTIKQIAENDLYQEIPAVAQPIVTSA